MTDKLERLSVEKEDIESMMKTLETTISEKETQNNELAEKAFSSSNDLKQNFVPLADHESELDTVR